MAEPSKLSLKLLIDKKANKVLFAEAGKEAVDFICSILTLPLGTVTSLLSEQDGMVGCLSDLYQSIENLNEDYVQPNEHKDILLKPRVYNSAEETPFFFTNFPNKKSVTKVVYRCSSHSSHVTNIQGTKCPYCQSKMTTGIPFVEGSSGGFVKEAVTYMVTDNLAISPTSAIAGLSIMNKLNVDVTTIEEKVVDLDTAKGLKMLKTSFQSKNVLTEVFLQGQHKMEARKIIDLGKFTDESLHP